jgi:PAS domain S-box-containing protein
MGVNRALQSSLLAVVFAALAGLVASRVAAVAGRALDAAQAARREAREALRRSEQRWATTLASIGDAVIATDIAGRITFMNPTAESATGWTLPEAAARPVTEVFHIINEYTREEVECPVVKVLREGVVIGLANHTLLVRRDGAEVPIDDSGAHRGRRAGDRRRASSRHHGTPRRSAGAAGERGATLLFENMHDSPTAGMRWGAQTSSTSTSTPPREADGAEGRCRQEGQRVIPHPGNESGVVRDRQSGAGTGTV